jgi:hypothetical protein
VMSEVPNHRIRAVATTLANALERRDVALSGLIGAIRSDNPLDDCHACGGLMGDMKEGHNEGCALVAAIALSDNFTPDNK